MTEADTMPSLSKDSAPNVQVAAPAVDRGGDLDDTTVDFVTIKESHSLAPLLRGLPGDSCQCPPSSSSSAPRSSSPRPWRR
jgi:hypothetical protein